ncbi:MAG: hypothetical protein RL701_4345 [Pseudomonadota bacterium]|jgi:predicted Zn-dependent protease
MDRGNSAELRDERFEGGIFSSSLPGGRSGARLTVAADGVVGTTPEGQEYLVPFAGATFELAGASGKMWFCRTPDRTLTIFSEAPGFATRMRELGGPEVARALAALHADTQQATRRSTLLVLAGLAVVAVLAFAFSAGLRTVASRSIGWVPIAVDKQLGDFAVEHMELSGHVTDDKLLNTSVRTLLERLEKATKTAGKAQFTYHVRVVEGSTVNAFALPGGQIVVYTGLLREAASAEQVAGVLAHELAHVTRRHGMQRIVQSVGVVAAFQLLFGDVSGIMAIAAELLREGAINSYSRDHEHEADMDAVATLARAHIDADALADFFASLQRQHGDLPAVFQWLGTHPDLAARIRDVRAERSRLGDPHSEPLAIDWNAVRARAGFHAD